MRGWGIKKKHILLFLSVESLIAFDESNWSFLKSNGSGVLGETTEDTLQLMASL